MGDPVELGKVGELPDGAMKQVAFQGREILLARVKDRYYAADGRCPHMGGDLSQGKLDGTVLTCPRHSSQFDLVDGHVIRWTDWSGLMLGIARIIRPPRPLRVYPVKLDGERIMAEI